MTSAPPPAGPAATEAELLAALPATLPDLVFVSGMHRSGTTFLHQWLADTGRFSFVTPFDLVNFERLLETHAAGTAGAERAALDRDLKAVQPNRGLDECGVGAGVAEEYGFLLPKEGEYSFFTPSVTAQTRPRFEALCRKMAALAPVPRPLVLKNPDDHYANFAALHAWYPAARFVFIHRHPLVVLNSQTKAWIGLLETPNPYFARISPFYRAVFAAEPKRAFVLALLRSKRWAEQALTQLLASLDYYARHAPAIPAAQRLSLRYEDLCADPVAGLGAVHAFLGLPAPDGRAAEAVRPRPVRLLPHVAGVFSARAAEIAPRLAPLGYETEPPVAA